ncbi:MAG: glycoside hydrolase family 2 TIM barrel-domain containing protein [Caldilineaceae bacterium]
MLYPQSNPLRQALDVSGIWDFCIDPDAVGESGGWMQGLPAPRPIAVPASWNDQYLDLHDYLGLAWYQTAFDLPWGWDGRKISLRFGSVNYLASVWVNGELAGRHEGGHLPFEFDISALVRPQQNRLVVCVDGALAPDRVPPGNVPPDPNDVFSNQNYPAASFDFFPYCGIHRPVWITARHPDGIADLKVTTAIDGADGKVAVELWAGAAGGTARFLVSGHGIQVSAEAPIAGGRAAATLTIPSAMLWEPGAPQLYTLAVEVHQHGAPIDQYTLPIGIRTIVVAGDQLLLNGKPIVLRGFGRHEDFAIVGRGQLPPVVVKDYALLEWIGANSFRTSHYPYSEEMLMLADCLGYLVIAETPAVGLFFAEAGLARR